MNEIIFAEGSSDAKGAAPIIHSQLVISIPNISTEDRYMMTATTHAITENRNCLKDNPKNILSV